jgi:hypothetical protein
MSFRNESASSPQRHRATGYGSTGQGSRLSHGGMWLTGNTSLTPLMLVWE